MYKEANMSDADNFNERNQRIIHEFRASGGVVGGSYEGRTLLLLHTTGARSGKERINPVAYIREGENFVVVASKGGAPDNPDWYHNILAHPRLTVEVGPDIFEVDARETEEPERSRLYDRMVEIHPNFDEYRRKTERVIPVIMLKPVK